MNRTIILLAVAVFVSACAKEPESPSPAATDTAVPPPATAPAATAAAEQPFTPESHRKEIEEWQKKRATGLQGESGWLTLVGLHWLSEGANSLGNSRDSAIPLTKGPAKAGTLYLEKGNVRIDALPGSGITAEGKPVTQLALRDDTNEQGPTELHLGTLLFYAIKRGDRYGIRMKDPEAETRKNFKGLQYYPIDPKWRIEARFEPYNPPKKIPILDVTGVTSENNSPGAIVFEVDGQTHRLDPILEEGSDELFVIFGDKTNGPETYGAGRYLYTKQADANGRIVIDFNRAYNPPCAFTNYATCPLPPSQNKLQIPIPAGEKKYGDH